MQVGVALPQMAPGFDRARMLAWCRGIDEGPFSSISAGERITFFNAEMITLLSAAAVLTERVEVLANVCVSPWHRPALLAKQFTTIDVLSGGRLTVALGVGGRQQDYDAVGVPFARRHQRVDDDAAELRRLWNGGSAGDGPIGPAPLQPGGPALLCSSLGPKSMARAARWASGVSGFAITGQGDEAARLYSLADQAWAEAGRTDAPRRTCGAFVSAGVADELGTLRTFARDYLGFMGDELAELLAGMQSVAGQGAVAAMLDAMERAGTEEVILVPASSDPRCLAALTEVVAGR